MPNPIRLAVIGAGLAGTACARAAGRAGVAAVLFDKGRGPGGRLSSRRAQTPAGEARFDHGAQYLTARGEAFAGALAEAQAAGAAAPWTGRIARIGAGNAMTRIGDETRWVGAPGMNGLVRALQDGLAVEYGRQAVRLAGGPGAWTILFSDGAAEGPFTHVALTLPPVQLAALLRASDGGHAALIAEAEAARLAPCWAVMAAWQEPLDLGFDGARIEDGPVAWAARMASRPKRPALEAWVLHASPDWSRAHLEAEPDAAASMLVAAFCERFGASAPVFRQAHRWRYSLVEQAAGTPYALDNAGIGAAGDWRLGARAEQAFDSGFALGAAIAASA